MTAERISRFKFDFFLRVAHTTTQILSKNKINMLSKDQAFTISEFVYTNSNQELWEFSDKFTEILSEFVQNDQQKDLLNKFLIKNGTRYVFKIEKFIYELIQKIISSNCVAEEVDPILT